MFLEHNEIREKLLRGFLLTLFVTAVFAPPAINILATGM
jgi:hypothetical protein